MKTTKQIYKSLPGTWKELKFKDFQKLLDIMPTDNIGVWAGLDNMNEVICRLSDVTIDELKSLPYADAAALVLRISFITELPEKDKSFKMKFKTVEQISFNDFLNFIQSVDKNELNIKNLIKAASYLTDDEIDELNMEEVWQSFFLLSRHLKKYRASTIRRLKMREIMSKLTQQLFRKKIR